MSAPRSLVRLIALLVCCVFFAPLLPSSALAQDRAGGRPMQLFDTTDSIPPEVHIVPGSGTFADSMLDVTIYWCDDKELDPDSRTIKHGGTGVVGSFTMESIFFAEPCLHFIDVFKSEGTIDISVSGSLTASIKDEFGVHTSDDQASYTYEPEIAPTVWTTPMNEGYRNTAIEAANGFEMLVAHATPGYVFKNKHRGLTFVYRSGQRHPTVLVQVRVSSGGANPDKFSMKVKDPSGSFMTFVNTGSTELFWDGTQSTVMLGGVVDASGLGTGAHDLTMLVRSHFGGSWEETADTVRALVVDESASPYGAGWSIAGIQRAHEQTDGSVLITEGDGSAVYFEKSGASFTAPNGDFSTLVTSGGGYKRTYANGDEVTFDANGRMTEFRPLYHWLSGSDFSYETNGALKHLDPLQSSSISTTLVHEGDSILVHEGEKNGIAPDNFRTTVIRLNGSGRVMSIEGPDGNDELSFGYTANRITQVTDRRGETTDLEYDDLGFLASTELPQISVDGQGVRPKVEQQSLALTIGPDSTSGEGTSGNPATPVAAADVKPWVEDARGARTYFTLDSQGFRSAATIEEPLGRTTKITRNIRAQVTRVDRPNGAYSTTSWSGPRMTGTFESTTGHTVLYEYASPPGSNFNQPVRVHDNKGNREIWYQYDGNDHLSAVYFDTIGGPLLASYERTVGRLTSGTDSDTGHQVKYEYDGNLDYANLEAVHRIRGTDTLTTRFEYDEYGRRVKTINPAGDSTFMAYDDLDRVLWSVNALGDTTYFDHDGYLVDEVEDAEGQLHRSAFNALGWATMAIDPNGDTTHVGYDANGNVISAIDRSGNVASFGYDSLNLPAFEAVEGDTTHLWVDPDGLKSAAWNTVSADTTVFDAAGRPVKQIVRRGPSLSRRYVIESAYDDDGPRNRVWVSTPGSIDYDMRTVWNDEGRIERLTDHVPATPVHTDFVYNDHHQLEEVEIGGTKRWEYDYSSFHPPIKTEYVGTTLNHKLGTYMRLDPERLRITEIQYETGDSIRYLEYDEMDQVKAVTDSAFTDPTCHYDPETGWYCWGPSSSEEVGQVSFAYDAVGNRTDSGADTDTGNRLTDLGAFSFTHDGEGRTLTKSASGFLQTYHWSARSQLDSVTTESGGTTVVRYAYDGLGRRISRDGPGGFEEYLYDGPHVVAILDDQQDVVSTLSYYPGVDKPHSLMTSAETYYYATDPTGSVIGLAEFTGAASVTHRYRYDVWGRPQGGVTEAVPNPLRFKARLWDEDSGLADFRARWYDPDIGRFISEDPIGLAGGINVYRFVGNDPVGGWDPFGMSEDWWCRWETVSTSTITVRDGSGDEGTSFENTRWVCTWIGDATPGGTTTIFMSGLQGSGGKSGAGGGAGPGLGLGMELVAAAAPLITRCRAAATSRGGRLALGLGRLVGWGAAAFLELAFPSRLNAPEAPSLGRQPEVRMTSVAQRTRGVRGDSVIVGAADEALEKMGVRFRDTPPCG